MTPRAGPLRVLIVDDEPAIVRILRASLESQGYIVSTAAYARTALDVVRKGAADLLVLDLGSGAVGVLEQIREALPPGIWLPRSVTIRLRKASGSAWTVMVCLLDLEFQAWAKKHVKIRELLCLRYDQTKVQSNAICRFKSTELSPKSDRSVA